MKNIYFTSLILVFVLNTTIALGQDQYKADISTSEVHWKGFKPTGDHYGNVKLKNGSFTVKGKKIVGGEFHIDMNTIVDLDMPADNEYNAKLVGHLKSEDFFGVEKHPTAKFKVVSTENKGDKVLINGELTIKEKTHPVSFLAIVKQEGNKLSVKSDVFKIDRAKWDIKFKSKSFFEDLADNFIYDDIEMSIEVAASK